MNSGFQMAYRSLVGYLRRVLGVEVQLLICIGGHEERRFIPVNHATLDQYDRE
jgi:hypothetical protein